LEIRFEDRLSSNQQLIPPLSDRRSPHDFPQTPPDPVSIHCFRGNSLAYHEPESGLITSVRSRAQHEEWMGSGYAALTECKEVALTTKSPVLIQALA
jgi:hypothetical protein